jgi:RND family efflux transporter MFP subunit
VASGFSRKAAAVVNPWIASRSLPARAGSHTYVEGAVARVLAALTLATTLAACKSDPPPPAAPAAPVAVQIGGENVVTVSTQDISTGPLISGTLMAEKDAHVRSEVSGSILQVTAAEGQNVRRGALLARIEDQAVGDAYKSAQSAVKSAEQALGVAAREAARTESLVKGGALAERELDVSRNAVTAAQAQVEDAKSRLASAAKQVANLTIRSPIDGVVAERPANTGDVVSQGTELYHIIDPRSMRLEAAVPSEALSLITIGLPVQFEVRGYPGQPFAGRIERISPAADPVTRQVSIFVNIPNTGGRLVAGLFAEGRVAQQARRALVVPLTAVNTSDPRAPWVLRVAGGKAERVTVTVGLRDDQTERIEISSGVKEGDRLLVGPAQAITPGTPLELQGAGNPAAPAAPAATKS